MAKPTKIQKENFSLYSHEYHVNPFVNKDFTFKISILIDKGTYYDKNGIKLNKTYKYEHSKSVKYFPDAIKRNTISKLTNNAKSLWLWIISEINGDEVKLNEKLFKTHNKGFTGKKSFQLTISELIKNDLIKKSDRENIYFVNPDYIYSGNRIKSFPNHAKVYREQ